MAREAEMIPHRMLPINQAPNGTISIKLRTALYFHSPCCAERPSLQPHQFSYSASGSTF